MKKLRTGIDNYSLFPLKMMPMEMLKWASENGAEGVSFSGYDDSLRELFTSSYLRDTRSLADDLGLFIEWGNGQHVPMDLEHFTPKEIYNSNWRAIGEAYGLRTTVVRSCSGGLMRWKKDSPSTGQLLRETARELKRQAAMFRDNGIVLAIETHFEFTTFELLALFDMCEVEPGDYLGICLDTMNLLIMLEDPVSAAERILPWVVSTHIKDGGVIRRNKGLSVFPAPIGAGVVDLERIIRMLHAAHRQITLSVEDHGGSFAIPVNEEWFMDRFPDLSGTEFKRIYDMCDQTAGKMKESQLCITQRNDWPSICEERSRVDIRNLRALRDRIISTDASAFQI